MSPVAALLIGSGLVGGLDVIYFHIYRCRLFSRRASYRETIAHLAQSASFVLICSWVGEGFQSKSAVLSLFALHFTSVGADILLERASRIGIGGISVFEYVLHAAGLTTICAALTVFLLAPPFTRCLRCPALLAVAWVGTAVSSAEFALLFRNSRKFRLNSEESRSSVKDVNGLLRHYELVPTKSRQGVSLLEDRSKVSLSEVGTPG
jgi:hypothetical protein